MINKIRITQNKSESKRLAFVKAMKDISGLGLKEAKDLSDTLNYGFDKSGIRTIEVLLNGPWSKAPKTSEDIRNFIKVLNEECTGSYVVTGGIEWERESKLLTLGVGTEQDYADFIVKVIMTKGGDEVEKSFSEIISNLDRTKLEEIFNKLIEEIK